MKRYILLLFLLSALESGGQTFSEWFKQKKTQTRYSLAQIAALQAYGQVLSKGYAIAKDGLELIGDIRSGDFDLHRNYFQSLADVNPSIRDGSAQREAEGLHFDITRQLTFTTKEVTQTTWLSIGDKQYAREIITGIRRNADNYLQEVNMLMTDGQYQLKDDERIKRIGKLIANLKTLQAVTQQFANAIRILIAGRQKSYLDIQHEQQLFDQ